MLHHYVLGHCISALDFWPGLKFRMLGPTDFSMDRRPSAGLTGQLDSMPKNVATPPVPSPHFVYGAASEQHRADMNKDLKYHNAASPQRNERLAARIASSIELSGQDLYRNKR
jgi:hypothetical protein